MSAADAASLWQASGPDMPPRAAPSGTITADLLVIGGGFAGLSTALHAAMRGQDVVLVEARSIGWGASGRNAGFVVPNFARADPEAIRARLGPVAGDRLTGFAAGSADLVFELIARHAIACDALQSGWIQPAHCAAALARTGARARAWAALGRPAEVLDAVAVARLTGARGYLGGWIDRSGGVLDPLAYARGLARAAETAGARLHEAAEVTALRRLPGGWEARSGSARIEATRVAVTTNAHAGALLPGLARGHFPLKVFQIATEPLPIACRDRLLPGGQCVSDSRRNLITFRFDAANRLISGGMAVFGPGADTRVPRAIHRRLARILDLADLPPIAHAWSGMAAVMPDFLPHLVSLGPGLIAGLACNGRGIAMTTALGRVLADWAGGATPETLPLPFGPAAPIPWHGLMRHAPNLLLPLSMLRDRIETMRARPGP